MATKDYSEMSLEEICSYLSTLARVSYMKKNGRDVLLERIKELMPHVQEISPNAPPTTYTKLILEGRFTREDWPKCDNDGCENFVKLRNGNKGFSKTCGKDCHFDSINAKNKESSMEKYGVEWFTQREDVKQKKTKTVMDRYGVSCTLNTPEAREKQRASGANFADPEFRKKCFAKFGGNPVFDPEIRQKMADSNRGTWSEERRKRTIETNLEKYGVEFYQQQEHAREAVRNMNLNRDANYRKSHSVVMTKMYSDRKGDNYRRMREDAEFLAELYNTYGAEETARMCNCATSVIYVHLANAGIPTTGQTSAPERNIAEIIESYGFNVVPNDRYILGGKEIDIYIPEKGVGIEYHGLYWHSTEINQDIDHIRQKYLKAEEAGIRLIQVFEDEWIEKRDIVIDRILNVLGVENKEKVFARKTKASQISLREASELYAANHIQGPTKAVSVNYGLHTKDGELVAAMSFFAGQDGQYTLARFGTSKNVVGGFSKLLKAFIRNHSPKEIISFADLRWSAGGVYEKNGFELEKIIPKSYYYVIGRERFRKEMFRHSRMAKMADEGIFDYNPDQSELENTLNNGIYRIYDCGMKKYKMTL